MSQPVRSEIGSDGIVRLTLDDPSSRANTLNRAMWEALGEACAALRERDDLRGLVLLSVKPGIFVAGADLREIAALPIDDPQPTRELVHRGRDVLAALESLPFPTVAFIDGAALGGGFELALACDFRLAGPNPKVKVGLPEVKLGLIPGWGGTQRPARIIGLEAAARLVCAGDPLSATQGRELGLIDGETDVDHVAAFFSSLPKNYAECRLDKSGPVVNRADLSAVRESLTVLTDDQRPAGEAALRVVQGGATLPLDQALALEESEFVPLVASPGARRLIAAFLQR
jgi:enoyl-CoA hydratase/carnithine racemase